MATACTLWPCRHSHDHLAGAAAAGHRPGRSATVPMPGSKSVTNRALVLAALADGPSVLRAPAAVPGHAS